MNTKFSSDKLCVSMKKTVLCLGLMCCSLFYMSGQEKWDGANRIYTNSTYHFHWALSSGYSWTKISPRAAHTVFKAESDPDISVVVNIRSMTEDGFPSNARLDAWELYDELKDVEKSVMDQQTLIRGQKGELLSFVKCRFAGVNAVKSIISTRYYGASEYSKVYMFKYMFFKGVVMWTVTFQCPSSVYNKNGDEGIDKFFAGFGLD